MDDNDFDSYDAEYEGGVWEWDNEFNELRYTLEYVQLYSFCD